MLFTAGLVLPEEARVIERITSLRHDLRHYVAQEPRRWTGLLARMTRARAIRGSNSIEGIDVTEEDAIAAVDGEEPADADRATWRAVVGYQKAMEFLLQRCRDDRFRFSLDTILAAHFMITEHDLAANPGRLRPGWVGVRNALTGELVHEGVDRDRLDGLLEELLAYMNDSGRQPLLVKAALVHLNIAMLHPFSDGNGRVARCLQTAVLARDGIIAPIFSSIEEYIGHHQETYYAVLAEVGGGGWNPTRDCRPWTRFCLTAHYRQAQTLLRRSREFERVYVELAEVVDHRGLPERTALALVEAAFGVRVRNASYRVAAAISHNLASRDLKALVDAGLLIAKGERRGRSYSAGETVWKIRESHRMPKGTDDPFSESGEEAGQRSLFE